MFWFFLGLFVLIFLLCSFARNRSGGSGSIIYIAGNIGAGKTAYSVKLARQALKSHRIVYSTEYIQGCYRLDLSDLSSCRPCSGSLIIVDELALKANSRDFAKLNRALLAFFKLCRHYKCECILISQTFGDTDKQIRELASRVLFIRSFGFFSAPCLCRGDMGIGLDGQPCVKYRIAKFGKPFIPRYWGRYYNTYDTPTDLPLLPALPWDMDKPSCIN